jgi:hypothetical protein
MNKLRSLAEKSALKLSHFEGKETEKSAKAEISNYTGYEGGSYSGVGDDLVDFQGGGQSFASESMGGVSFGFSVANASAATKTFSLLPTYLGTAAAIATATGETVHYLLADGTIDTNITGTAKNANLTIANLQNFTKGNPARITSIIIESNTAETFARSIAIHTLSPFRKPEAKYLDLTRFIDPNQQNDKKAIIPIAQIYDDLQLNDQTAIIFTVGGTNVVASTGERVNFTIQVGAVSNLAGALKRKAIKARETIAANLGR